MFPQMSGENRNMSSQQRVDRILELIDSQLEEYDAWCAHDAVSNANGAVTISTAEPLDALRLSA